MRLVDLACDPVVRAASLRDRTASAGRSRWANVRSRLGQGGQRSLLHEPLETICEVPGSARVRSTT